MRNSVLLPLLFCLFFFIVYALLSVTRFNHYDALGFDLGLMDQIVWKYSTFRLPISTIHFYPFQSLLADHVELIYIPVSFLYRIVRSPVMLLGIEPLLFCLSGLAIYALAKEKKLHSLLCYILLFSYLTFYGVQHALWFGVHSISFGAAFLAWFLYVLEKRNNALSLVFFLLAIFSKENIAALTFCIALYYFVTRRRREDVLFAIASVMYLFFIFFMYFPYGTHDGYRYGNEGGLTSNVFHVSSFLDTQDKRSVIFYTLAWFGFIPLLNPLTLLPALGDLWNYFVVASNLRAAQGLFMHYRITLAPLMVWSTILTFSRVRFLQKWYVYVLLFLCPVFFQYQLHLPLSYVTKNWFWTQAPSLSNINTLLGYLPADASVVSQNNITPHISQRDNIFTLWPEKKSFAFGSPCPEPECNWFRWAGSPEYLIVDTSTEWDIRHLLANRDEYVNGLENMQKAGIIEPYKQIGNAVLYKVKQLLP